MSIQATHTHPEQQNSIRIVDSPSGRGFRLEARSSCPTRETRCSSSFPMR